MLDSKIIKEIDIFLIKIDNPSKFILNSELEKLNIISTKAPVSKETMNHISEFKERIIGLEYVEPLGNGLYGFTSKGYEAKSIGGHFVYQKSLTPKMTKFEKWSLLISILALLIAIIPYIINQIEISELKSRLETLEKET